MKYLITGASSGIGKRLAERLLGAGHECILVARNNKKLAEIASRYKGAYIVNFDLSNLSLIEQIFEEIKDLCPLDGMIHCAGVAPLNKVSDNTVESVLNTYSINVFSFVECMRCFVQDGICDDGASVVAMSSVAGQRGSNRQAVYSGTKAALDATARCMSRELAARHIRVNTVVSGAVETEMFQQLRKESINLDEKIKNNYPLGIIPVDEVCDLIEYLLSDKAAHITGCSMPIDSGFLL